MRGPLLLALLMLPAAHAAAQDAQAPTSNAPPGGADHSLFDPVPADQLRDMDTDRPNLSNTPHTVDAGHLQIEAGLIDYQRDKDGSDLDKSWTWGEVNLRLGVLDRLELNLDVTPWTVDRERDGTTHSHAHGFGDLVVGGKLNLWGESGDDPWSSGLAIQPQIKLPTAAHDLGNGHVEVAVMVPFQMALPAGFHLGLQPTLSRVRNSANKGDVTGYQGAAAIDHDLIGQLDVYAEYSYSDTSEHGQPSQQTLDLGGLLPIGKNLQLDSGVMIGLNHAAPDVEWLAGVSARF